MVEDEYNITLTRGFWQDNVKNEHYYLESSPEVDQVYTIEIEQNSSCCSYSSCSGRGSGSRGSSSSSGGSGSSGDSSCSGSSGSSCCSGSG
ncbi:unnamed protein product, partial [Adineta steineri]